MGKNKKRKSHPGSGGTSVGETNDSKGGKTATIKSIDGANDASNSNELEQITSETNTNPLYTEQQSFLSSLTRKERDHYFSPHSITPARRAELWMEQAEIGEGLVNRYAWATPTKECLKIFRAFSPIVEVGSGSNAYWANYMTQMGGIDVIAYDRNIHEGGKILHSDAGPNRKKRKQNKPGNGTKSKNDESASPQLILRKGGPEVLDFPELKDRTLFLCYPDEEDAPVPPDGVADDDDNDDIKNSVEQDHKRPLSFGWHCLNEYKGKYVIHVGELAFFDATLNMEQSPWGRSSSSEFQQRLASEFHCIAKIQLPNWLHVRDSISVWKRSEICQMVFVGDEDDESEEMIEYRHIPPEEMLPTSITAPCMERLLLPSISAREGSSTVETKAIDSTDRSKHNTETKEKATGLDKVLTDQKGTEEDESEGQSNSKKTKRGRRRERQKQKKIIIQEEQRRRGKKCEGSEEHSQEKNSLWLFNIFPPPT
mmetsp:Transcript_17412/g.48057  ORF Transcript_17412/g.48057 Transcript_17412/m.48057 type:complete len:483 (+) Transcript_17412:106-1554(+)